MKRRLIIIVLILIFAGGLLLVYRNTDYYYSKKLIAAIEEEDIIAVQQIIQKKPTCINTYPSIAPRWWRAVMEYNVFYPLTKACYTDNIELVILLLENGADPNCNDGKTPLSATYGPKQSNWYAISQTLIEYGAELDYVTDGSGGKASIFEDIVVERAGAALPGYEPESEEEVIKAFHFAIENCDLSNVDWMRVLQHSVIFDRIEIVKFLLDEGYCDVNDTSIGVSALMFAATSSDLEMVQLLLDYGADENYRSPDGKTAYDYAVERPGEDTALKQQIIEVLK